MPREVLAILILGGVVSAIGMLGGEIRSKDRNASTSPGAEHGVAILYGVEV